MQVLEGFTASRYVFLLLKEVKQPCSGELAKALRQEWWVSKVS